MKVVIDRPWSNAELLGQTKEFFNFNANQISAGDPRKVHDQLKEGTAVDGSKFMAPSWSTAFVVVKDVHIVITSKTGFENSEIDDMQKSSASGGGFLCFHASKSSASSDHRDAYAMRNDKNTISIRIPAPQILGWISQLAPEDVSLETYNPFGEKEFAKPPTPAPTPPAT